MRGRHTANYSFSIMETQYQYYQHHNVKYKDISNYRRTILLLGPNYQLSLLTWKVFGKFSNTKAVTSGKIFFSIIFFGQN